jgi:peptide-methionine (S)-S-oxide reductase
MVRKNQRRNNTLTKMFSNLQSRKFTAITFVLAFLFGCGQINSDKIKNENTSQMNYEVATLGAGCFWCVEAVFQNLKGVIKVESGYSGGKIKNPAYREVCSGTTGHAEVCQITFDKSVIKFEDLLEVFWKTHDPTTLNYQGNDHGTQYRSVIFYHNSDQKQKSEFYKSRLEQEKAYENPIVTEISPFTVFYKAEDYHQNYYNLNSSEPYCKFVIQPKLDKFKKAFKSKVN